MFRGRHIKTAETVAIKVIDLEQAEDEIEDIQQEISVMAQCDSPHVTQYFGSYVVGTKLYLIMEYVGGGSVLVRCQCGIRAHEQLPSLRTMHNHASPEARTPTLPSPCGRT